MNTIDRTLATAAVESRVAELEDESGHVETFRHADGSATVIMYDDDASHAAPREDEGNVATLINCNAHTLSLDDDAAGLDEARRYFNGGRNDVMMRRYLAMFRPDIAAYVDHWSAGDSFGWGYVTTAALEAAGLTPEHMAAHGMTPASLLDAEVKLYRQWADGEVYGAVHITVGEPIVAYGEHGAYVADYTVNDSDTCWGFLGYDSHESIVTDGMGIDSPIV